MYECLVYMLDSHSHAYARIHLTYVLGLQFSEEGFEPPGSKVTDHCESPCDVGGGN